MKYLVLVNNSLQMSNKKPIYASQVNGTWTFYEMISRTETQDITAKFNKDLKKMFQEGRSHYLKPFTIRKNFSDYFHYEVNEVLRILHLRSEIYQIQVKLFEEYNGDDRHFEMFNNEIGERVNLIPFFLEVQEQFLIQAVESYSHIVNYIEYSRNNVILSNTYNMGIAFKVDKERWMNIVSLKMMSIDNPFSWLIKRPVLSYSKLVKFLDGSPITYDFNSPQIFSINEKNSNMVYYTATPKDILELLNIKLDKPVDISSMFVVQLIGACLLKALGFELKTTLLPSTTPQYYILNDEGTVVKTSWERETLTGEVYEMSTMSAYLEHELGSRAAGAYLPEFEGMRLT